eukprot:2258608-Pleurochrysis_carterae.AAC.1
MEQHLELLRAPGDAFNWLPLVEGDEEVLVEENVSVENEAAARSDPERRKGFGREGFGREGFGRGAAPANAKRRRGAKKGA